MSVKRPSFIEWLLRVYLQLISKRRHAEPLWLFVELFGEWSTTRLSGFEDIIRGLQRGYCKEIPVKETHRVVHVEVCLKDIGILSVI